MSGQRGAGTPFGATPTHHTDEPGTWRHVTLIALGCAAVVAAIAGIAWLCGAWTP